MADVYTVTLSVIGILISMPALLVIINLLMPDISKRAQIRLTQTPGRSFWLGIPITAAFALFIAVTSQVNIGAVQAMAFIAALLFMGIGSIGGAGLARLLSERIHPLSNPSSKLINLMRGAVMAELAALVPIVGWFLFAPLAAVTLIGAAAFALVKWLPRSASQPVSISASQQVSHSAN